MKAAIYLFILGTAVSCLAETKVDNKHKRFLGHEPVHVTHISSGNIGVATSSIRTHGPAANVLLTATPSPAVTKVAPVHTNIAYALPNVNIGDASFGQVSHGLYQQESPTAEQGSPELCSEDLPAEAPKGVPPTSIASQANIGPSYSIVYAPNPVTQASKGSSAQQHETVASGIQSSAAASLAPSGVGNGLGLEYAAGFQYGAPAPAPLSPTTTSQITVEQPVPVPVYHPVRITIPRPAPYHVLQPYPVEVPRPVHVPVPHPVPINVPRPYPVTVNKPYPITVPRLVPVPVPQPVPVEVPRPYPVQVSYPVPVRLPYPVEVPVATPVSSPAVDIAAPAAVAAKPAFEATQPIGGASLGGGPWSSSGLGDYASLFSSLNLGGSSYSAPSTGSYSLDISPSVEIASSSHSITGDSSFELSSGKLSGNLQGAPLKAPPRGGPSGEKWTGLLTNSYKGTANRFQGYGGNQLGAFRPSKLVGSSLITAGRFSGAGGATFRSNSFKAEEGDDYFPYP